MNCIFYDVCPGSHRRSRKAMYVLGTQALFNKQLTLPNDSLLWNSILQMHQQNIFSMIAITMQLRDRKRAVFHANHTSTISASFPRKKHLICWNWKKHQQTTEFVRYQLQCTNIFETSDLFVSLDLWLCFGFWWCSHAHIWWWHNFVRIMATASRGHTADIWQCLRRKSVAFAQHTGTNVPQMREYQTVLKPTANQPASMVRK